MRKKIIVCFVAVVFLTALTLAGCAQSGVPAGSAAPKSAAADTANPEAKDTEKPQATEAATQAPAAPQDAASSPALRYYRAVTLGMTKDEADMAIGLPAEKAKGEFEPEGSYNYVDGDGNGVYVIYNKDMKAFSKVALYARESTVLAPLTATTVTKDQKDQIKKGTTHTDIAVLLGGDGVECTLTAMENEPAKPVGSIYRWANADGTFLQVAFDAEGMAQNILFQKGR